MFERMSGLFVKMTWLQRKCCRAPLSPLLWRPKRRGLGSTAQSMAPS